MRKLLFSFLCVSSFFQVNRDDRFTNPPVVPRLLQGEGAHDRAVVLPDAGLLEPAFTNAGMNQSCPSSRQEKADVSKWAGAVPGSETRAADTQNAFARAANITTSRRWARYLSPHVLRDARELVLRRLFQTRSDRVGLGTRDRVWKFPAHRLYATVYKPDPGDPGGLDQGGRDIWAEMFGDAGLDPQVHIVFGTRKRVSG